MLDDIQNEDVNIPEKPKDDIPKENEKKPLATEDKKNQPVLIEIAKPESAEHVVNTGDTAEVIQWSVLFFGAFIIGIMVYLNEKGRRNP